MGTAEFIAFTALGAAIVVGAIHVAVTNKALIVKIFAAFVIGSVLFTYSNLLADRTDASATAPDTSSKSQTSERACADSCSAKKYGKKRSAKFRGGSLGNYGGNKVPRKVRKTLKRWHANHRPATANRDVTDWFIGTVASNVCKTAKLFGQCGGQSEDQQAITDVTVVCGGAAAIAIAGKGAAQRTAEVYGVGVTTCMWQVWHTWYKINR